MMRDKNSISKRASGANKIQMADKVMAVCIKGSDALVKLRKDGEFKVFEITPTAVE